MQLPAGLSFSAGRFVVFGAFSGAKLLLSLNSGVFSALFRVHVDEFSESDSHPFNRQSMPLGMYLQQKRECGETGLQNSTDFTQYSPFTSWRSIRTLGERSWRQGRTSFAYLDLEKFTLGRMARAECASSALRCAFVPPRSGCFGNRNATVLRMPAIRSWRTWLRYAGRCSVSFFQPDRG